MKTITFKQFQKEFVQFLIENNAYKPYLKAFRQQYRTTKETEKLIGFINPLISEKIVNLIKKDRNGLFLYLIDASFTWSKTKEGHDFWSKLNELWEDKMTNVEIITE